MEEIQTRRYKVPPKLRTMLILMDGTKTADELQLAATTLGVPAGYLEFLEQSGFIERSGAAPETAPAPGAGRAAAPSGSAAADASAALGSAGPPGDEAGRFRGAQKFMLDTAVSALGVRSFFFTLKLEKCGTRADLAALLDEYGKAIRKGAGDEEAEVLLERARELLK